MTPSDDHRMYLPRTDDTWTLRVMSSSEKEYCHGKFPGEPYFHLLIGGELHLDNGEQKYCLECGLRLGLLTFNRTFWQKERAADVRPERE